MNKYIILTLVLAAALPFTAGALTITQTDSFTNETLDYDIASTFNKFDDQGGTLTLNGVTISVSMTVDSGGFIADNDSDQVADITFSYNVESDLSADPVYGVNASLNLTDSVDLELDADDGDGSGTIDGTPPDGVIVNPSSEQITGTQNIDAMFLPSYVGTGTFDTLFESSRSFSIEGSSGVEGGYTNMTGSGSVEVVYDYVPEPATLAILGLGGLFVRRRRQ